MVFMINYDKFWKTIKEKGVSTYALREKHRIGPGTLTRMHKNNYLSLRTIEDLCKILDCKIEDIVEYIPDENQNT